MLLVITGIIQSIPKSIYEASSLEGATKLQNFRFLTFPLVLRAMIPLLIGSFAFNLNNFVGIYLLTGGGPIIPDVSTPLGETDILISYTYRLAFEGSQGQNFGMASAVSMVIFVIVVSLTVLNFKVSKKLSKT
jgi:maltose/maltodextrin transport system permease protein